MKKTLAMILAAALGLAALPPLVSAQQGRFEAEKKKPTREEARERRRAEREERREARQKKREERREKREERREIRQGSGKGVTSK